jgi:ribosome-binding factor A
MINIRQKDGRIESIICRAANEFILRENNGQSIVTVTKVEVENKGRNARIFFTVLPETMEIVAIQFLKRKRKEFREYMKNKTSLSLIPWIDFDIDKGEKNRQKIEKISF